MAYQSSPAEKNNRVKKIAQTITNKMKELQSEVDRSPVNDITPLHKAVVSNDLDLEELLSL